MPLVKPKVRDGPDRRRARRRGRDLRRGDDRAPPPEPDRHDRVRPLRRHLDDARDGRRHLRGVRRAARRGGAAGPNLDPPVPQGEAPRAEPLGATRGRCWRMPDTASRERPEAWPSSPPERRSSSPCMAKLDRLEWATCDWFEIEGYRFGVRSTSAGFGEWVRYALGSYRADGPLDPDVDPLYALIVEDGATPQRPRLQEAPHLLLRHLGHRADDGRPRRSRGASYRRSSP